MTDPASGIRVLALVGSLRPHSYTRRAVEIALEGARGAGADVHLLDLSGLVLPFRAGSEPAAGDDVARLRHEVRQAQGILWGSPEYHGSFSGVLKNALDLTEVEDWRGKVVGLVGISGGSSGPAATLAALRNVSRALDAWVVPHQVAIASAYKAFDEHGQTKSADLRDRLVELGRELVHFAQVFAANRR